MTDLNPPVVITASVSTEQPMSDFPDHPMFALRELLADLAPSHAFWSGDEELAQEALLQNLASRWNALQVGNADALTGMKAKWDSVEKHKLSDDGRKYIKDPKIPSIVLDVDVTVADGSTQACKLGAHLDVLGGVE